MPRVILDASFVRGASGDSRQLLDLASQGYRPVITDTLIFELCTASGRNGMRVGQGALRKLQPVGECAEYFNYSGFMMRSELKSLIPFGDPARELQFGVPGVLENILSSSDEQVRSVVDEMRVSREDDPAKEIFAKLPLYSSEQLRELSEQVDGRPIDDPVVTKVCHQAVNCLEDIYAFIEDSVGLSALDQKSITWHYVKSFFSLACDYIRKGETNFSEIQAKARKRWVNRMHDLEYLILLNWADAIASEETSGEQCAYRRWMYGDEKRQITLTDCE